MTRDRLYAELIEVLNTASTNGAWSETTLWAYLAEGQDKFCEQTGFFVDFSNYSITLQTGLAVYAIPERVIEVLDIYDGGRRLGKFQDSDRRQTVPEWDMTTTPTSTGRPQRWQADAETGSITFDRVPTAAENGALLQLRAWRYSRFALDGLGAVPVGGGDAPPAQPEIPSRFRRACVEWAAYKAFNHHDMEAQDPVKARDHKVLFDAYVKDGKLALQRLHGNTLRVGTSPAYRT